MCGFNILPGSACRPERILLTLQWCSTVTQSTRIRSFVDFHGVNTDCSGLWYISRWSRIRLESEQERCMWSSMCLCVCSFMCVLYSTICVCVPLRDRAAGLVAPLLDSLGLPLMPHCFGGHGTQAGRSFPASTTPSQQDPQLASVIKWDGR